MASLKMTPNDVAAQLEALASRLDKDDGELVRGAIDLIEQMSQQIRAFKHLASWRFRRKSEKVLAGQLPLALVAHLMSGRVQNSDGTSDEDPDAAATSDSGNASTDSEERNQADAAQQGERNEQPKGPKRPKRKSKVHVLPVVVKDKTLTEEERKDPKTGRVAEPMGVDIRRQIIFEPAKLYMLEEHVQKYALPGPDKGILTAPSTPKLIERGLASSSLLSHLVVSRLIDTFPIERLGRQLSRHGADLAPSTLNDWFAACAAAVMFLDRHARDSLMASYLASFDDTPLLAKRDRKSTENGGSGDTRPGLLRGRLWLYLGDVGEIAYCQYTPDWKGSHPKGVLSDFKGEVVQQDGYRGSNGLFVGPGAPRRAGCNDHARRRFVEAHLQGDTRAEEIIALYNLLYAVEREATVVGLDCEQRLKLRRDRSVPVWDELLQRLGLLQPSVSPKSPLGKAIGYWFNQRDTLALFLSDGRIPISNVHVERLLRLVALFRRNSLYVGSEAAGKGYATLLTLALNCILCGANPYEYFQDVFHRIAGGWSSRRGRELLPRAWLEAKKASQEPLENAAAA